MQSLESGIGTARVDIPRASRFARHKVSAAVLAGLLVIVGLATAWNLEGWPGRVDDDEGTYVAQAWAIVYEHTITHYSYWYDHPPLGWVQIALFGWLTDGFNRVAAAVFVGRQFMWCLTLAGCVLLYVLCRRLGMRRTTSAITVALFGLSPLGQFFHRLVSLDNVATVWVLAALRRRHLAAPRLGSRVPGRRLRGHRGAVQGDGDLPAAGDRLGALAAHRSGRRRCVGRPRWRQRADDLRHGGKRPGRR